MSPISLASSSAAMWAVNGLLVLVLTIVGFSANREIVRNDEQELRLRAVEQACVELKIMRVDLAEMKGDVKLLLRKP